MKNNIRYQERRRSLGATYSRTLFVIHSGSEQKRSHSVRYRFKATSDFSYLTGLNLTDAILLVLGGKTLLLWDAPNETVWGEHTAIDVADQDKLSGITVLPSRHLNEILKDELSHYDRIAASFDRDSKLERSLISLISYNRSLRLNPPLALCDSRPLVGAIRLRKDEIELLQLKEAGLRSSRVHRRLLAESISGKTEREISNWIEAQFLLENMQWTAYETIVGSGERSTLLHARATDRVIQNGELVLVDAGGEWNGYCADITRTIPAGYSFSKEQTDIYDLVLTAQKAAIEQIRPGSTLVDIHETAASSLKEGLLRLGVSGEMLGEKFVELMPHQTSHWIGMDVHDPSPYITDSGEPIRLESGMCFTIEPGLYFRAGTALKQYRGLGVRIEDNVIVTESGKEVLSNAPKEREEIEELRGNHRNGKASLPA